MGFVGRSDKTLPAALKAATETGLPVMLDTDGRAQSASGFWELRAGDIYTNIYSQALPPPNVRASGVLFDGSHGGAGFWFRVAAESLKAGFCHTRSPQVLTVPACFSRGRDLLMSCQSFWRSACRWIR